MLFSTDHLTSRARTPEGAVATAVFPASWPLFAGHFAGNPVVPAYVLLGLVRATAELARGKPLELARVERVKLTRAVRPGEEVRCSVVLDGFRAKAQLSVGHESAGTMSVVLEQRT